MFTNKANHNILSVNKLKLLNFRNYRYIDLSFPKAPIIISGDNGCGKTNILEAISLLSPGRGLRSAKLSEIDKINQNDKWKIDAKIEGNYGICDVSTFRIESNIQKRLIRINSQNIKNQGELTEVFNLIWFTPQMCQLFVTKRNDRLKFLDRLVYNFDNEHAARIINYENLMKQRSKLLKDIRYDPHWLSSIEHNMAEFAVAIACSRIQTIDYLQNIINNSNSAFPGVNMYIEGEIELQISKDSAVVTEESFKNRLFCQRELDYKSNRTSSGVHLSDLILYHKEKNIKANLCSTGEQKAMLIAILVAEARSCIKRNNSIPVLLLDEVIANLDNNRKDALFYDIINMKAQAFITTNNSNAFHDISDDAEFINIETLNK